LEDLVSARKPVIATSNWLCEDSSLSWMHWKNRWND